MGELKPCPFCGGAPTFYRYNNQFWMRCEACHYVSAPFDTARETYEWWDRRPEAPTPPETPRAEEKAERCGYCGHGNGHYGFCHRGRHGICGARNRAGRFCGEPAGHGYLHAFRLECDPQDSALREGQEGKEPKSESALAGAAQSPTSGAREPCLSCGHEAERHTPECDCGCWGFFRKGMDHCDNPRCEGTGCAGNRADVTHGPNIAERQCDRPGCGRLVGDCPHAPPGS